MRGLLDNAAGEGGPDSAALPQDRRRSSDTHPVYYSGPCNWEGPSGAAGCCASTGHGQAALWRVRRAALSLGQVSQSHGGVYLPPALMDPSMSGSIRLLLPVNTLKDASAQIKVLLIFCPPLCQWRLWGHFFFIRTTVLYFYGRKELHSMPIQWKPMVAMYSNKECESLHGPVFSESCNSVSWQGM